MAGLKTCATGGRTSSTPWLRRSFALPSVGLFPPLFQLASGEVGLEEAVGGGFGPGGLPEVAEVLGAGFELDLQENFSGGGGFWAEPFVFVQLIKGFHFFVLGEDVV